MGVVTDDSSSINILLVDDQALLRQSLAILLENQAGLNIVGAASDGHEAIKQVALCRPDVVLLDIEMPNLDGLSATRLITQRFPQTKVIVLSAHDNEVYLRNALKAGAKAYLLKNTLCEELSETVRLVYKGYSQFSAGVFDKMVAGLNYDETPRDQVDGGTVIADLSFLTEAQKDSLDLEEVLRLAKLPLALLDRFEPNEVQTLVKQLLAFSDVAIALQADICRRLANTPTNLVLLYLHGTLAHQFWSQPDPAFSSLQTGFQTGLEQAIPAEALLLFYQQAAMLKPDLAFRWLTQSAGPWDNDFYLPFLSQEATRLFGASSSEARSIVLLNRIRILKQLLQAHIDKTPALAGVKT